VCEEFLFSPFFPFFSFQKNIKLIKSLKSVSIETTCMGRGFIGTFNAHNQKIKKTKEQKIKKSKNQKIKNEKVRALLYLYANFVV